MENEVPTEQVEKRIVIQTRRRVLINTDPQRRCYNGCHFSSEWRWTAWVSLERWPASWSQELIQERLDFWRGLNKIAVDGRGEGALCEFEAIPEEDYKGPD